MAQGLIGTGPTNGSRSIVRDTSKYEENLEEIFIKYSYTLFGKAQYREEGHTNFNLSNSKIIIKVKLCGGGRFIQPRA